MCIRDRDVSVVTFEAYRQLKLYFEKLWDIAVSYTHLDVYKRQLNMYPYIPNTPQDEQEMLQAIGLDSMDLLFEDIPKDVRLTRPLNIPPSKSELEVSSYLKSLADKNCSVSRMACFLGAGAYDHYIPSVIDAIISRSEFYTSYTPYQPEISQGTLQYIFEYQTLISNLTGMDLANASLYDGGTAVTEAALMACCLLYTSRCV